MCINIFSYHKFFISSYHFPLNFQSTSSAVEIFSMWKMNPFLSLFLASCLFFISHSQTTSNTSFEHHCLPDQSHTLLQLRQEFVQKRLHSENWYDYYDLNDYYNVSYPKMKSWKADSDCCSWDGVTCDPENGHVVGDRKSVV